MSVLPFRAPRRRAIPSSLIVSTICDSSLLDSHGFSPGTIFIISPIQSPIQSSDFLDDDLLLVRSHNEYFIVPFQPPSKILLRQKLFDLSSFEVIGRVILTLTEEEVAALNLFLPQCIKHVL